MMQGVGAWTAAVLTVIRRPHYEVLHGGQLI
jgi:hypothetical protein